MFLGAEVARPQPLKVGLVKGVELQKLAPGTREWQPV